MKEHGICAKCKKSVGCPYADDRIKGCKKFMLEDELELTNEEWFCQLPTTEKSEFLSAMVKEAIEVYEKHGTTWHEAVSWWDGWLKAKHE